MRVTDDGGIESIFSDFSNGLTSLKLDTNGSNPDFLRACLPWIDYVAFDVKTSPEKYKFLRAPNSSLLIESIMILMECSDDYEFRIAAVPSIVDSEVVRASWRGRKGR
jgi:pyruvate-formate lyase-activating enzyme